MEMSFHLQEYVSFSNSAIGKGILKNKMQKKLDYLKKSVDSMVRPRYKGVVLMMKEKTMPTQFETPLEVLLRACSIVGSENGLARLFGEGLSQRQIGRFRRQEAEVPASISDRLLDIIAEQTGERASIAPAAPVEEILETAPEFIETVREDVAPAEQVLFLNARLNGMPIQGEVKALLRAGSATQVLCSDNCTMVLGQVDDLEVSLRSVEDELVTQYRARRFYLKNKRSVFIGDKYGRGYTLDYAGPTADKLPAIMNGDFSVFGDGIVLVVLSPDYALDGLI